MSNNFVHLHIHSEYSLLDGAARIDDLLAQAKKYDMPALALTDHGVMYGAVEFYEKANKCGVKPIIGCEVYVAPRSRFEKSSRKEDAPYHLLLLAENNQGYRNLMELSSLGFLEGFYYKPRVDKELLKKHSQGLIASSACVKGEVFQLALAGRKEEAEKAALEYQAIFGQNNFFLEIQNQNLASQDEINQILEEISQVTGIPLVATNDIHYTYRADYTAHDALLCIQTGSTLEEEERLKFGSDQFYLKSYDEMRGTLPNFPSAIDNTLSIAERCNVQLDFDQIYLPHYETPEGLSLDSYLKKLCHEGLKSKYPNDSRVALKRLDYELEMIKKTGFSGYFLIVWDFVKFAKENGIRVGPGRGSVAGSIVAYVLDITSVDPLEHGLFFERFLNPERVSMPDIDIDFDDERRDEVINYVASKYGEDRVAQIVTFGTMKARAAIRDAGRVLNVPYGRVDKIAKLIPAIPGVKTTIDDALKSAPELAQEYEADEQIRQVVDTAKALEGLARHDSVHAAGVVISRDKLTNYTPLQRKGEGEIVTQYPMEAIERIGLLKMDFLGLRTLTVIGDTIKIVKRTRGIGIDIDDVPFNDEKTYKMLQRAESIGVFQLESTGMRGLLKDLAPNDFEDIVNLLALYRPGPLDSGMVADFVDRRHGRKPVSYLHPSLEPVLKSTYGTIVYQEQVMQIAVAMAGFSMGQADILRKAMAKPNPQVFAQQRERFVEGAEKKEINPTKAGEVFDLVAHFAGYGFNRCVVGDTEIVDAESGKVITVGGLWKSKKRIATLSYDDNLKIIKAPIVNVVKNGKKPVYKLRTHLGKEIIATGNHPFLTFDGWKNLEDLKLGERIAAPRVLPVESNGRRWSKHKLVVLAGVLSEGNTCHPSGFYYYNNEQAQIDDFVASLKGFDDTSPTVSQREDGRYEVYAGTGKDARFKEGQVPWNRSFDGGAPLEAAERPPRSGARLWIESLNLDNKKATEKFIPSELFKLSLDDIALFLGRLWSGDGFLFSSKVRHIPFYATSSKILAEQIQQLLLRFGILSRIAIKHFKYRKGLKTGYALYLQGKESINLFLEEIAPHMVNRESQIMLLRQYYKSVPDNSESKDVIPAAIKYVVQREKKNTELGWRELERDSQICMKEFYGTVKSYKHGFRRSTIRALGDYLRSSELLKYANSQIYWDKVVSIEYVGEEETYDIEVEGTHNFVANGLIIHNSHSTGYAMIAYQTAYLKANYPVEFMAALLTSEMGNQDKIAQHVNECRRMQIEVLPPDVNESFHGFTAVESHTSPGKQAIRFGLSAVRNVGDAAIGSIVKSRKEKSEFKSIYDFCERVDLSAINKRALESLIKSGAFSSLEISRKHLLSIYDLAVDAALKKQKDKAAGQFTFFDLAQSKENNQTYLGRDLKEASGEFPKDELLTYEKETLGLYVSDHPLWGVEQSLRAKTNVSLGDIKEGKDGSVLWVGGIITRISRITTKKGDLMLFANLEDLEGSVEVVVFPSIYQKNHHIFEEDKVVRVKGRLDVKEEGVKVIAQEAELLNGSQDVEETEKKDKNSDVYIRLAEEKLSPKTFARLKEVLATHPGSSVVWLLLQGKEKTTTLRLGQEFAVNTGGGLFAELKELLGEGAIFS